MSFTRNINTRDLNCPVPKQTEPIHQFSLTTKFLDLSLLYGETYQRAEMLRQYADGLLRFSTINGNEYPPQHPNTLEGCHSSDPTSLCFLSSDFRINIDPNAAVVQILLFREHNRLARELAIRNPQWNDEKLFQEARRINIAQFQYIVYYEWLPRILGRENLLKTGLIYYKSGGGYVNDYDPNLRPKTFNENSNSAFRIFHSQLQGQIQ